MGLRDLIEKGEKFLSDKTLEKAIEYFNEALTINPECKQAWYGKGTAASRSGEKEEALKYYNKALDIDSNYIGALKGKAWVLQLMYKPEEDQSMDELEEAIECYDKLINIRPHKIILTRKGNIFFLQEKYKEAIECYDKALEMDPDYTRASSQKERAENKIQSMPKQHRIF